jgi:hypothetical protein
LRNPSGCEITQIGLVVLLKCLLMDIRRRMSTLSLPKGSSLIPLFLLGPSRSPHFRAGGKGSPKIQGRTEGRLLQGQEDLGEVLFGGIAPGLKPWPPKERRRGRAGRALRTDSGQASQAPTNARGGPLRRDQFMNGGYELLNETSSKRLSPRKVSLSAALQPSLLEMEKATTTSLSG